MPARRRIRTRFPNVTGSGGGGGGGTGTVSWGPRYGKNLDDTFVVESAIDLDQVGLIGNLSVASDVDMTHLDVSYTDIVKVASAIDLDSIATSYDTLRVASDVNLTNLDIEYNVLNQVASAISLDTVNPSYDLLTVASAIDLDALAMEGNLSVASDPQITNLDVVYNDIVKVGSAVANDSWTLDFQNAGTYNISIPTGATTVDVELWGAGGAGGNSNATGGGGGGKGGPYVKTLGIAVTPGNIHKLIVAAGVNAGNGQSSQFRNSADSADLVRAAGGNKGTDNAVAGTGGAGATTYVTTNLGDTVVNGGNGAAGAATRGGGGGGGAGDTTAGSAGSAGTGGAGGNDGGGDGGDGGVTLNANSKPGNPASGAAGGAAPTGSNGGVSGAKGRGRVTINF